jgi:hypothetical protein
VHEKKGRPLSGFDEPDARAPHGHVARDRRSGLRHRARTYRPEDRLLQATPSPRHSPRQGVHTMTFFVTTMI